MSKMKHNEYWQWFVEKYVETNDKYKALRFAREMVNRPPSANKNVEAVEVHRLLNHPTVKQMLIDCRKRYLDELGVSPEKTLAEVAKLAFARLPDIFVINDNGEAVFDLHLMTPELEAAIGEYTVDTYMEGRGKYAREVKKVRVKLNNKLDALDKLMRYQGLYEQDNKQGAASLVDAIRAGRERARDKRKDK